MVKGSCLCGQVRYEINGEMGPITHCHCPTCRKAHAAAFSSVSRVRGDALTFTTGESLLKFYESSPGKKRYFCSSCGSHIYAKREDQNHYILRMGTIDSDPGSALPNIFSRATKLRGTISMMIFPSFQNGLINPNALSGQQ